MTNKQLTFKFLDAPMGAGKTTAIINRVKTTQQQYLIVTPYLEEITRICANTGCIAPINPEELRKQKKPVISKGKQLLEMIKTDKSICITQELFSRLSLQTLTALEGYSLIIDEEPQTISVLGDLDGYTAHDITDLINAGYLGVAEDTHSLYAIEDKHCQGVLSDLYNYLCALLTTHDIYMNNGVYIHVKKRCTWEYFKDITICSYRLHHSILQAYCQLNTIATQYQHIENGHIVDGYLDIKPANLHRLQCYTPQKLNASCSVYWYQTHTEDVKTLVSSFNKWRERHVSTEYRKGYYWTTYKAYTELITKTTKKLTLKKFVSCNAKATNKYRSFHVVGVFMQRFLNVPIALFLKEHGIQIDEKEYALSELLQFIWRSNIRTDNNTPVFVFIGSRKLYDNFIQWQES